MTSDEELLERERAETVRRLREIEYSEKGSHANLSQIFAAIMGCPFAWNAGACQIAINRLIWLIEGEEYQ